MRETAVGKSAENAQRLSSGIRADQGSKKRLVFCKPLYSAANNILYDATNGKGTGNKEKIADISLWEP